MSKQAPADELVAVVGSSEVDSCVVLSAVELSKVDVSGPSEETTVTGSSEVVSSSGDSEELGSVEASLESVLQVFPAAVVSAVVSLNSPLPLPSSMNPTAESTSETQVAVVWIQQSRTKSKIRTKLWLLLLCSKCVLLR